MSDKTGIDVANVWWTPVVMVASDEWAMSDTSLLLPLRGRAKRIRLSVDLFHEGVTDEMRDRIFAVMALCPQHAFQVLTKRPERMLTYLNGGEPGSALGLVGGINGRSWRIREAGHALMNVPQDGSVNFALPLPNVWQGVSVENHKAKPRIDTLRATPATLRFLSLEPLLEDLGELDLTGIDWVIVGGESGRGPGIRPMHPHWVRSLRDQCKAAGVPFFFKQWGEYQNGSEWKSDASREVCVYDDGDFCGTEVSVIEANLKRTGKDHSHRSPCIMARVGKKAAGDLLDGVRHHAFPEVQA